MEWTSTAALQRGSRFLSYAAGLSGSSEDEAGDGLFFRTSNVVGKQL
jgi:hypothetical protein